MKINKALVLILLVSLWVTVWSPPAGAAAGSSGLTVDNKTGSTVTITLSGAGSYTIRAVPGKSSTAVAPGKYKFSYRACGANKTGTITVLSNPAKLTIAKCVMANITIQNDTGGNVSLSLTGPASYFFTLGTGKSKITAIKGKYDYRVSGVCGSKTGTVTLGKGLVWRWWCY